MRLSTRLRSDFNPRSPRGERHWSEPRRASYQIYFNPRSPRGERLYMCNTYNCASIISIHAPRGGSDFDFYWPALANIGISIHAPRGGSDVDFLQIACKRQRISIHAPRGGSDPRRFYGQQANKISIHAPRGGSDNITRAQADKAFRISIHAPRGGSDLSKSSSSLQSVVFQSTLPAGGATGF